MTTLFRITISWLIGVTSLSALDRYVAPPPLGSDTNPGTEAQPYATINQAAAEALAGDTVWIAPGIYQPTSPILPANSGTETAPITYRARPGGQVIIDGQSTVPTIASREGLFYISGKSWIVIDGLRIINSGFFGFLAKNGSSNITIRNCSTFFTYASGICAANSSNIKVLNNTVQQACMAPPANPVTNTSECITMASVDTFEVAYNLVFDRTVDLNNGGEGIDAKNACSNGSIHHNIVHDLIRVGIYVDAFAQNLTNVEVHSNTVYSCSAGMSVASEAGATLSGVKIYNNLIYDCRPGVGIRLAGYLDNGPLNDVEVYQNTIARCGNPNSTAWENSGILVEADNPLNSNFISRNNILSGNTRAIRTKNQSYLTIDRNLIDGPLQGGVAGTNSIQAVPQFIDAANDNFRLAANSPAIDTAVGPQLAVLDFDGNPRPAPGPGSPEALGDLGAFEWVSLPTTTTLTSSSSPSPVADALTITATVTAASGIPEGTVAFFNDTQLLGTNTLDASGATTLTTSALAVGILSINGVYTPAHANFEGSTSPPMMQEISPSPQAPWVKAYFTDGNGTSLPYQFPGTAGEGWLGSWTNVLGNAAILTTTPLLTGSGKYLSASRPSSSGSGSGNQAGVYRQWDTAVRPANQFSRLVFDFRIDSDATFNNVGDAYNITINPSATSAPGGSSSVYLRCFGASPGTDFNGDLIRTREWCVFHRAAGADGAYAVNKFIRTGMIAVPGTTYQFTVDIHAAGAPGATNGKSHGTYDVTISDGSSSFSVPGSGFRSGNSATGTYLAFATQQNLSSDDLAFSVDSIEIKAQPLPGADSVITLATSGNPSTFGYGVTFTATVTGESDTPTGSVSFYDGAALLGTDVLDGSGVAAFTTSSLLEGNRQITAVYSGDGNYEAGTSSAVSQTVNLSAETVGHWRFESSPGLLEDSSGHGHTLTTQGSAPTLLPLPSSGPATTFPRVIPRTMATNASAAALGPTGNFTLADTAALQLTDFTIEAYIHPGTATFGTQYIASQFDFQSGSQRSWALGVAGTSPPGGLVAGELFLNLSGSGTSSTLIGSGFILETGTDLYVAASVDASNPASGVIFYLKNLTADGELIESTRANPIGTVFNSNTNFQIGSFNNGASRWQGVLDEVRLSRAVLDFYQLLVSPSGPVPVSRPVIMPPVGAYFDAVHVTITSPTPEAAIHYTVNGSTPTAASTLYTAPFNVIGTATVRAIAIKADMPDSAVTTTAFSIPDLSLIGTVKPPHARNITDSNWSVGGETVDRDYTVFANYKDWLGPLGIKRIRQQAGWFKCEKVIGVYDWAWLDECVDGAIEQGLQPWLETNYGNPIYPGGGGSGLGAGLPTSETALAAWDNWVTALVDRYKDRVYEWEVWNEPDNSGGQVTPEAYAAFYIRTAEIIRARQPESRLYALAVTGPSNGPASYVGRFFAALQTAGKLGLVTAVTAHAYPQNPDTSQSGFIAMRDWINTNYYPGGGIEVRQGESGAPSQFQPSFALANLPWSELTQAKWNLRRLLGDLGHDIPSSIFAIIDMKYYGTTWNYKGLLKADENLDVDHPKQAYFGVRNIASIFDDSLTRITGFSHTANTTSALRIFGYQKSGSGKTVASIWFSGGNQPVNAINFTPVDFTLTPADIIDPVWVDMRDGSVRSIPTAEWSRTGDTCTFTNIPVYDSPILIADRSAIPLATPMDVWRNIHFTVPLQGDESISGDLADPDRDNSVNLLEYALGSNPTLNSSTAAPVSSFDPGGQLKLSFDRTADPSLLYEVQGSDDLLDWDEVWSSTGLQNTPGSVTATDDALLPVDRRFLRLRVTRPPN